MAITIRELADSLGLRVNNVKQYAGLERGVSSAKELSPELVQKVRLAVRDRASAGLPAVEPAPKAEEQAAQAPVIETKAEETETPQPEPEPEQMPKPVLTREPVELEPDKHRDLRWLWIPVALIFVATLVFSGYRAGQLSNPPANATPTPIVQLATEAPATEVATEAVTQAATEAPATEVATEAATQAATEAATEVPATDGKAMAEAILGKTLPWPPETYSSHQGQEGYPDNCAGLCWNTDKLDQGIMVWYGPNAAEEDITQSDAKFGNGTMGPLDLMRTGKVTKVIFANAIDAQLEICAIGTLDGKPLTEILSIREGACGKRVAIAAGWHVIEGNANSPIAGFGVRFTANGWSGMSESQIVEYTKYWTISGDTATWIGPEGVEIMMTPSMVQMMQDFAVLKNVVFTTNKDGNILFCNGTVSGSATLSSPDGACHLYEVKAGTFTYHGEARLSAGISWQPAK